MSHALPRVKSVGGSSAAQSTTSLASVIQIAERTGRTDLAARIQATTEQLRHTGVEVWVLGEHKKGKSSLVNAMVNADVCPSDPVWATVVPIRIDAADEFHAESIDLEGTKREIELDQLVQVATELGNAHNELRLRHIAIGVPRRLLNSGITFVDAPGVGGLESAVGSVTLSSLGAADGAIYVTDCSQELTSTELSYLSAIRRRCKRIVCVMSKRDLYLEETVETILARNRLHLDSHDLGDVAVVAVSSTLHLLALARQDPVLETESGFDVLFDVVHDQMWQPVRRQMVAETGRQLGEVATHLALPLAAELASSDPEDRVDQSRRLEELQKRLVGMQSETAAWQQGLNEGIQDLMGDADHDLRERLRSLARLAEARIDAIDERDDLALEAWLRKSTVDSIADHYSMVSERASALAEEIGARLRSFDAGNDYRAVAPTPDERLGAVHISRQQRTAKDGIGRRIATVGQGYSSGFVLTSSVLGAGALVGGTMVSVLFPFLALPVAGLMAKRSFGDDRARRDLARVAELKRTSTKYLDEVSFIVQKDSRDTVRRLHREIRTHFTERTEQLRVTIAKTIEAVNRAGIASDDVRADDVRTEEVRADRATVAGLQTAAAQLASVGLTRGAA